MTPLVSIMIPAYNASSTLPLALTSLLAQSYTNWECLLIDDGSATPPIDIVNIINDNRIQFIQVKTNRGRAATRQKALDLSNGKYVSMIDADDWIYPNKLEHQVKIIESHPDIAVLSTGMAIVDDQNRIVASRVPVASQNNDLAIHEALSRPQMPQIAHAPSMLRASIAKQHNYDMQFTVAEDADFLLRIMLREKFAVLSDITYVYKEIENYTLDKMTESIYSNQRMFAKYKNDFPSTVYKNQFQLFIKAQIYRIAFGMKLDNYFVKRRSQPPTATMIDTFNNAQQVVYNLGKEIFSGTSYQSIFE